MNNIYGGPLTADNMRCQDIRLRVVLREYSNVHLVAGKTSIKLPTRVAPYIDECSRNCDHHYNIRMTDGACLNPFQSSISHLPATYGCLYLNRLAISNECRKSYFSPIAAEKRDLDAETRL